MRARAKRMRPYAVSPTQASSVVRVRAGKRSNSSQGKQLPLGVGYTPCDDRCLVTRFPHHGMRGSEKIAVTMYAAGRIATTALAESPHGWTGQVCHSRRCCARGKWTLWYTRSQAIRGTEEEKCYLRHMTLPTRLSLLWEPDGSLYSRSNCPGWFHARPGPG